MKDEMASVPYEEEDGTKLIMIFMIAMVVTFTTAVIVGLKTWIF